MTHQRPPSVSNFFVNLLGGVCYIAAVQIAIYLRPDWDVFMLSIVSLVCAIIPILFCEVFILKAHRRKSVGLIPPTAPNKHRVAMKLIGYYGSIGLVALGYWIIPEYTRSAFYNAGFYLMIPLLMAYIVIGWLYITEFDRRLEEPEDGLYHFGCLLVGRFTEARREKVIYHLKSVALRGFFIPVMLTYLALNITLLKDGHDDFAATYFEGMAQSPARLMLEFFIMVYFFLAAMDTLFAVIGYLMTFRVLDSHIRSTEPTFLGWFICIICYYPFWEMLMIAVFFKNFYANPEWHVWMEGMPVAVIVVWGALVIAGMCLEAIATLSFGIRFSNLTYRGLLSSGPFRFTKHPQYIFKMMNRFCFYMPFLSAAGVLGAAHTMLMFVGLCFVYYLRARTEENHLSRYPEYVEYANWMNENGVFKWINRYMPFLKYNEEKAKQYRLF